jgi:uncharacterized protein (DUF2384 family)
VPTEEEAPMTDAPELATPKPQTYRFRRRFEVPRLSPEAAERQGRAARVAWDRFRESAAVIAFLNTHDDALGGRPIDLAVASQVGLAAVERALEERPCKS